MAIFRSFFAGLGFLTFLVILAASGWFFRDDIAAWLGNRGGERIVMVEPSPELAAKVEDTLRELAEGGGARETRLTETELQSYFQYRLIDQLPPGVEDPAIDLRDSTIVITAKLDFTRLSVAGAATENLRRMLGDSARVSGEVYPQIGGPGEGRIQILSLQAGIITVPPFLIGAAIEQLGLRADGAAVLVDIPEDVVDVRVENEEIIFLRDK